MISDVPSHERNAPPTFTLESGRIINIRDIFPKTGCYDAATFKPIWQVDWFSFLCDLQTSSDFVYVVRRRCHARYGGNALEFYADGSLVRAYTCDDLLQHVGASGFLPTGPGHWHARWYHWHPRCRESFQLTGDRVSLSTARREFWMFRHRFDLGYQEHYTFDVATGQIRTLTYSGVGRLFTVVAECIAILLGVPLALWWLIRFLRRRLRAWHIPATHCRNCSYDLTGNLSGICPECGHKRTLPEASPPPPTPSVPACQPTPP